MLSVIISDSCLQGLKRGIMEHCHLVVVNKADGELKEAAMRMQYEYTSSLKFMRPISPNWRTKVSALCHQPRSTLTCLKGSQSVVTNKGRTARAVGDNERVPQDHDRNWGAV